MPSTSLASSRWAPGEPCCGNLIHCYLLFPSVGGIYPTGSMLKQPAYKPQHHSLCAGDKNKQQQKKDLNRSDRFWTIVAAENRLISASFCCSALVAATLAQGKPNKQRRNSSCYCWIHCICKSLEGLLWLPWHTVLQIHYTLLWLN